MANKQMSFRASGVGQLPTTRLRDDYAIAERANERSKNTNWNETQTSESKCRSGRYFALKAGRKETLSSNIIRLAAIVDSDLDSLMLHTQLGRTIECIYTQHTATKRGV